MANQPLVNKISDNYEIWKVLGQGSFGQVVQCFKRDTRQTVAVKISKHLHLQDIAQRELYMLDKLRRLDPEKNNIIKCYEWFCKIDRTFMVFEMMDMSVWEYLYKKRKAPLPLHGIRTIIKDVATALDALKGFGVIHTDLKTDNIMLVNHQQKPFRVKLIDFGSAVEKYEVWHGLVVQPLWNRAPEVLVGAPFNQAIDVWSLGTVMAELLLGFPLFPGKHEYDVLRFIFELLGELPHGLLKRGIYTSKYFYPSIRRFFDACWNFMTPYEYYARTGIKPEERRKYRPFALDDLKTCTENSAEAAERSACVDLLKEMLQMDPNNRITTRKILEHPFIQGTYPTPSNQCATEPHPRVIMVEPAKNTMQREEAIKPQAVEDKINSPEVKYDSDSVSESLSDFSSSSSLTTESDTSSFTTCSSLESDIETIFLESDSHDGASDTVSTDSANSTETLEASEPKKKKKGIRRFFSNLRRIFFCCCCVGKVDE